jgi:hypothetical protein
VNFWLIVAARPSNASEKLPSAALGGLVFAAPKGPKRHFFLAMKKK